MFVEAVARSIRYRLRSGEEVTLQPGVPTELPDAAARQLLTKACGKVRLVEAPQATPTYDPLAPPLGSGWLVVYRDRDWVLCGGCDDHAHGTVQSCEWDGTAWTVCLTDGQHLPLRAIRSVGQTDAAGNVVAAWTVRDHGYDGEGTN
jgi:hypothetical protein